MLRLGASLPRSVCLSVGHQHENRNEFTFYHQHKIAIKFPSVTNIKIPHILDIWQAKLGLVCSQSKIANKVHQPQKNCLDLRTFKIFNLGLALRRHINSTSVVSQWYTHMSVVFMQLLNLYWNSKMFDSSPLSARGAMALKLSDPQFPPFPPSSGHVQVH